MQNLLQGGAQAVVNPAFEDAWSSDEDWLSQLQLKKNHAALQHERASEVLLLQ